MDYVCIITCIQWKMASYGLNWWPKIGGKKTWFRFGISAAAKYVINTKMWLGIANVMLTVPYEHT